MEHTVASSDANSWGSFSSPVPTEDPEIMALLFSNTSLADESHGWQSMDFHPSSSVMCEAAQPYYGGSNDIVQNGMYCWPQGQGCGGNIPVNADGSYEEGPNPDADNYHYLCDPNAGGLQPAGNYTMDLFTADEKNADVSVQDRPTTDGLPEEQPFGFSGEATAAGRIDTGLKFLELASPASDHKPHSGKRRIPLLDSDKAVVHGKESIAPLNPRKKSRSAADLQKSGKSSVQARKSQKGAAKASLSDDTGLVRQTTSSSDSSEDDSIAAQQVINGDAGASASSKGNVKTRAGRGSATDPQSLYARKRRERINERLRILQNLVPNGTKVDISTMLEEAVQYVKFLQLQIKLLSSDDLWMYAPLAYNGMDIGLDLKITPPQ